MFAKIGEFFYFIFAVFVGLFEIASSGADYSPISIEQSAAYIEEHSDTLDSLIDAMIEYGPNPETGSRSPILSELAPNYYKDVKSKISERARIYFEEDGVVVSFELYGGSEGFSQCELLYYEIGNPDFSAGNIYRYKSAEWDDEYGCYVIYNSANYQEIYQLDENWFFLREAFYDDAGFRRK